MHKYVELAFKAIREYISNNSKIAPPDPLPDEMKVKAGVFVCLKIKNNLRGCIGTIEPVHENVSLEIIDNAISSAVHDSRFSPLAPDELEKLEITVDVLSESEDVAGTGELDPKVYGLIVSSGLKRGLLLPDLEGVNTIEQQIEICRKKGRIGPDEEVALQRFTVTRYR